VTLFQVGFPKHFLLLLLVSQTDISVQNSHWLSQSYWSDTQINRAMFVFGGFFVFFFQGNKPMNDLLIHIPAY